MKRIEGEWRYLDDKLGIPFPWYTKPALEVIDKLILRKKRVFEYGCGDSTKWYRAKGAQVFGVDTNMKWAEQCGVKHETFFPAYVEYIEQCGVYLFDIIVIDGMWRDECTEKALKYLKDGGLLIIDNYMQPSVEINWIKTQVLIEGMDAKVYKEEGHQDWQTLIVRK
jgi:hypothetical protein